MMKLSPLALAIGAAFVWGAAIFVIGGINSFVPGYGEPVLALVVSLYPGYDASGGFGDLLLGTAYAVFDGFAAGFVFALLYNMVAGLIAPRPDKDGGEPDAGGPDQDAAGPPAPTPEEDAATPTPDAGEDAEPTTTV